MRDLKATFRATFRSTFQGSTSLLAIFGACLFWLWMDSAVFSNALCALSANSHAELVTFIMTTLASVVAFACLVRRAWEPTFFSKSYRLPAATAMVCGTLGGFALLASGAWDNALLGLAGSTLSGVYFALFNVAWGWVCVAQGVGKALIHISAAWSLTLPFHLVSASLPAIANGLAICTLPLLSGAAFFALGALQGKPSLHIEPTAFTRVPVIGEHDMLCGVDRRLLLLIVVFCAVFGLMYSKEVFSVAAVGETGAGVVSVRAVTALLFFAAALTVLRDRVKMLFKVCFYVLVAGLAIMLISLFVPTMGSLSGTLVAIGYCGFDVLVWTMVAFHGHVSPNQPQRTVVVTMLTEQVGILLGAVVGMVVELAGIDAPTEAVMMVVLSIAAIAVLVAYTEYGSQMWGLLVKTSLRGDEAFQDSADELAAFRQAHRLTEREGDVLALVVQGRSFGHIAEKMFVSENTVKTHVRHIYAKCGVRGKQELLDLVERERESY